MELFSDIFFFVILSSVTFIFLIIGWMYVITRDIKWVIDILGTKKELILISMIQCVAVVFSYWIVF